MDYTALYREWRPQTFDELIGQDTLVRILKNQITANRISHAYLFSGSRGTGKTSTAKIFAKAINCLDNKDGNPCGLCSVCKALEDDTNLDVVEIDAASNTGVDHMREIRDRVKYPPAIGKYRVYIIDEVHMLSTSAFNAFLKTLEEPPDHIVFILATTEPERLPATILSRCQRYDFKRITSRLIMGRLREIVKSMDMTIEDGALEAISGWSEGGMRDAISLLDQCVSFSHDIIKEDDVIAILGTASREFILDMIDAIMSGDLEKLLHGINSFVEDGGDITVFIKDLISHLRNILIVFYTKEPEEILDLAEASIEAYKAKAQFINDDRLIRAIEILSDLDANIKWHTKPRVMVEMAMIKIARPEDSENIEALMDRMTALERTISSGEFQNIVKSKGSIKPRDDASIISETMEDVKEEKEVKQKPLEASIKRDEEDPKADDLEERVTRALDNLDDSWKKLLNIIKRERMPLYPIYRSTRLELSKKNEKLLYLIFPDEQKFYIDSAARGDNKDFIEDLIKKAFGQDYVVRLYTEKDKPSEYDYSQVEEEPEGHLKEDLEEALDEAFEEKLEEAEEKPNEEEVDIVRQAIDLFGEDKVEIIG